MEIYDVLTAEKFSTVLLPCVSKVIPTRGVACLSMLTELAESVVLLNRGAASKKANFDIISALFGFSNLEHRTIITDRRIEAFVFSESGSVPSMDFGLFCKFDEFYKWLMSLNLERVAIYADYLTKFDLALLKKLDLSGVKFSFIVEDKENLNPIIAEFGTYLRYKPDQLQLF